MLKYIIYLILIICASSICFAQTSLYKSQINSYNDKIRLNTKGKEFKDTLVVFRNYIEDTDDKRIICSDLTIDSDIYRLIWECKYIKTYLKYQYKMNKFSIVSCKLDNQNNMIASYYLCDRKTKETVEIQRLKISNKKIIGINILPNIYDGFVQIHEFENKDLDRID